MRWDVREWPMSTRLAAAALAAALVIDASMLIDTTRTLDVPPLVLAPVPRIVVRPIDDVDQVRMAAGRAPFGGTPATEMLAVSSIVQQSTVAVRSDRPRLLGTVVEGRDGGFVVVELPDARMQLVRIGEKAGDLRLRAVTVGAAVFEDESGGRVTLKSSPSESRP